MRTKITLTFLIAAALALSAGAPAGSAPAIVGTNGADQLVGTSEPDVIR